jgi:hypothetical protein
LIDFNADPDGDGVVNACEILIGSDPSVPNAPTPVEIHRVVDGGQTWMEYVFRTADASGLTPRLKACSELNTWQALGNAPVRVATENGISTWRVRDDVSLEAQPRRFFRLQIDSSDPVD